MPTARPGSPIAALLILPLASCSQFIWSQSLSGPYRDVRVVSSRLRLVPELAIVDSKKRTVRLIFDAIEEGFCVGSGKSTRSNVTGVVLDIVGPLALIGGGSGIASGTRTDGKTCGESCAAGGAVAAVGMIWGLLAMRYGKWIRRSSSIASTKVLPCRRLRGPGKRPMTIAAAVEPWVKEVPLTRQLSGFALTGLPLKALDSRAELVIRTSTGIASVEIAKAFPRRERFAPKDPPKR